MSLLATLVRDSQNKSARELARQQRREQREESRFGFGKSLLKTGLQFIPGVGKLLSAGVDIIGDPIARSFGAGADADDIKLSGGNLAFGGEQAAKDARVGLKDYLKSAKEGSISSGLTSLVSFGLDKGLDDKFGDMIGLGGKNPELQKEALDLQNTSGAGMGTQLIMDSLEEGAGSEWSTQFMPAMIGSESGTLRRGAVNLLDGIQKVSESNLNLPQGVSQMSRYADGATHSPQDIINALMKNPSDAGYLEDMGYTPDMLRRYASSKMPTYEQGGMVQKYENGGSVEPRVKIDTRDKEMDDGTTQKQSYFTTYTYDGYNWNEGAGSWQNPGYDKITQKQMDNYRSEQRTQDVSSTYMSDPTEFGIQEILKNPQLYSQVEAARSGNEGALANILEMVRQSRPDLEGTNEALTASIKKILPNIDLYGQGYQDVLAEGATTLKGLTEQATGMRAQEATQRATSGIRRPGAQSNISEGLYSGAEDVYSGMQRGIQGEFDKSFGEFDDMVNLVP